MADCEAARDVRTNDHETPVRIQADSKAEVTRISLFTFTSLERPKKVSTSAFSEFFYAFGYILGRGGGGGGGGSGVLSSSQRRAIIAKSLKSTLQSPLMSPAIIVSHTGSPK